MKQLFLILFLFYPILGNAQFSGEGSGTTDDPYQITNADELYEIRGNLSASYKLMYDIDLTAWQKENNLSGGWTPIGNENNPFKGIIDGNGKTVTFSINQPSLKMAGFIAYASYAEIRNLNIVGIIIAESGGGLIGKCSHSTVDNCTFKGSVSCEKEAGGLVCKCEYISNISKCSVSADISGMYCGGIATNTAYSDYTECSVWGNIKSTSNGYVGGLVGLANGEVKAGNFQNCYFRGKFLGTIPECAGGIVGKAINKYKPPVITNCIVIAPSIQGEYASGIAGGLVYSSGKIYSDCRSSIAIVDSLIYQEGGSANGIGSLKNVYDGSSSECLASDNMIIIKTNNNTADNIERSGDNGVPTAKTMLMKSSTYTSHGFDMSIWNIDEGIDYPYLACAAKFKNKINQNPGSNLLDTDISKLTDVVYIDNVEAYAGSQLTLSVKMKNAVTAEGFSFDLYLPSGVTVAKDEDDFPIVELSKARTTAKKTNSFDAAFQSDGCLRVLAASTNGSAINGNDGEVCTVKVNIVSDMEPGGYPILLKNIAISDVNAVSHRTEQVKLTLTIADYTPGDGNGDGVIDVSDFTATAHYLLGNAPTGFNVKAADANGDGVVDVADLTAVAHLILYGTVNKPSATRSLDMIEPK